MNRTHIATELLTAAKEMTARERLAGPKKKYDGTESGLEKVEKDIIQQFYFITGQLFWLKTQVTGLGAKFSPLPVVLNGKTVSSPAGDIVVRYKGAEEGVGAPKKSRMAMPGKGDWVMTFEVDGDKAYLELYGGKNKRGDWVVEVPKISRGDLLTTWSSLRYAINSAILKSGVLYTSDVSKLNDLAEKVAAGRISMENVETYIGRSMGSVDTELGVNLVREAVS